MHQIYDRGYKILFKNKTLFRQLIQNFVDENWVKDLDFDSCETLDKSFVSEQYRKTESDLIYKVKLKDKELYIFILIEFQSNVQRFMAVRVLNYITNFYLDYLKSHRRTKYLPPIFPIVLYNGSRKWTAPQSISDLIESCDLLGEYSIKFDYFKIIENEYSVEQLTKIHNVVSTLFLVENQADLESQIDSLLDLFDSEDDKQAISLLINYIRMLILNEKITDDVLSLVYLGRKEAKTMLVQTIEKMYQTSFEKGKLEGLKEGESRGKLEGLKKGLEEGLKEGKLEVAKSMFSRGLSVDFVAEITGLSENEILKLKKDDSKII